MKIETFGSIMKEEQLRNIEHDILPQTFVLENVDPLPSYYGDYFPSDQMPDSFFFITTQTESTEKIFRLTDNVRKELNLKFEGSPAKVCVLNETLPCIRVRGITEYAELVGVQTEYAKFGIKFAKPRKVDEKGIIHVKKVFKVEAMGDDVFRDTKRNMFYLKLKGPISWGNFRTVTTKLRNNVENQKFDAALTVVYSTRVLDLIRIYTKELNIDEIKAIHKKYLELIDKL